MKTKHPYELFVRQITEDGCGNACLAMILKYAGKTAEATKVNLHEVEGGGLSLLSVQRLAQHYGLQCRCVEMETGYLKSINKPVILHTVNELGSNHFVVCFSFFKNEFIIADPATQIHYLNEADLSMKWKSRAALYFEDIACFRQSTLTGPVIALFRKLSFPPGLLLLLPLLSLCVAFFGIALTWLLQKGITDPRIFDGHVVYSLITLLFIICLSRNLFTFLRQYILIRLNLSVNLELMINLLDNFIAEFHGHEILKSKVAYDFSNVQKMQNALSVFAAVILSDGFLTAILLISLTYMLPVAGLVNLGYLMILTIWHIKQLPEYLFQLSRTRLLSNACETAFLRLFLNFGQNQSEIKTDFKALYRKSLQVSQEFAVKLSRNYLMAECWGTITIIAVLLTSVATYQKGNMDYQSLMFVVVESYLITVLMQRICTSFQQLTEGVDAYIAQSR